jgi:tetratricopeptide (TPR) repeat protein
MTQPVADQAGLRRAYETALGEIEIQLKTHPDTADFLFERGRLLTLLGRDDDAKEAYLDLLRRAPTHFGALTNLAGAALANGYRSAAKTAYRQAVACHPENPSGLVNLANLLAGDRDFVQARSLYERALTIDPNHPQARQGLGQVLFALGERDAAERHWRQGYIGHSIVARPYRGAGPAIRLLVLASVRDGNIPTALLLDDRVFAVIVLYAEYHDPAAPLPPHDVVLNAIGDADLCVDALKAACAIVLRTNAPVLNQPETVLQTGRQNNATRFARVPGVIAPQIQAIAKQSLLGRDGPQMLLAAGFGFPVLLRSPGFQTGLNFVLVENASTLAQAAAALPGDEVLAIQFLDAAGSDDMIRKYRVMMIGGAFYPLHMAASRDWKVHYFSSEMASREDLRREEAAFLGDMQTSLGETAVNALNAICTALALDYAGIDFGLARDGRLIFFEANATMVIVPPPDELVWDYRRHAIGRALEAAKNLFAGRARDKQQ